MFNNGEENKKPDHFVVGLQRGGRASNITPSMGALGGK
jgi:hypothetical protein